ncbi:MAG: hypothetical protein EOS78_12980 [Mesorhizobium sp.]|nr:MAG: hypothetical protein EOS78_12980 [Mesorhizobium sp.]
MAFKSSLQIITVHSLTAGAAPHPPAGTFSPYGNGEKGSAPALAIPSPRPCGERARVRGSANV